MVIHQCRIACRADYARCRIELTAARLTVLAAAHALDKYGNKKARNQIAAAKVYAPNVVLKVLDQAVQVSTFCMSASSNCYVSDVVHCMEAWCSFAQHTVLAGKPWCCILWAQS